MNLFSAAELGLSSDLFCSKDRGWLNGADPLDRQERRNEASSRRALDAESGPIRFLQNGGQYWLLTNTDERENDSRTLVQQ